MIQEFLGIYPKILENKTQRDTCRAMFVTAAKVGEQPASPGTGDWIPKMWCIRME